ncbi:SymE family type I addiction module toxin [Pseudoxanthomonas putridarboris]|uniref:SymE family type I addiction module toxin n=1 Tax=Pseudoxanthomonas putridarboris TaxID=752605 RepID=A0ABU9IXP4_9GAMM
MTQRKSFARTTAPKSTRKPRRATCKLTLAEDPPVTDAPQPVLLVPAKPASPPSPRHRTPQRCTLGAQYYDERHGERTIGRAVPKLRLAGRWLEHCGFAVGDQLHVTVGRGVLLVTRRRQDG